MPLPQGAKVTIILAVIGIAGTVLRMLLQARTTRQLTADNRAKEERLAELRREQDERQARHTREAAEREAERQQKEKLIAQLQAQTNQTLAILERELKVQQDTSRQAFEMLDRNTRAVESLAQTVASQASDLRLLTQQIAEIKGGAGCRSNGRGA